MCRRLYDTDTDRPYIRAWLAGFLSGSGRWSIKHYRMVWWDSMTQKLMNISSKLRGTEVVFDASRFDHFLHLCVMCWFSDPRHFMCCRAMPLCKSDKVLFRNSAVSSLRSALNKYR